MAGLYSIKSKGVDNMGEKVRDYYRIVRGTVRDKVGIQKGICLMEAVEDCKVTSSMDVTVRSVLVAESKGKKIRNLKEIALHLEESKVIDRGAYNTIEGMGLFIAKINKWLGRKIRVSVLDLRGVQGIEYRSDLHKILEQVEGISKIYMVDEPRVNIWYQDLGRMCPNSEVIIDKKTRDVTFVSNLDNTCGSGNNTYTIENSLAIETHEFDRVDLGNVVFDIKLGLQGKVNISDIILKSIRISGSSIEKGTLKDVKIRGDLVINSEVIKKEAFVYLEARGLILNKNVKKIESGAFKDLELRDTTINLENTSIKKIRASEIIIAKKHCINNIVMPKGVEINLKYKSDRWFGVRIIVEKGVKIVRDTYSKNNAQGVVVVSKEDVGIGDGVISIIVSEDRFNEIVYNKATKRTSRIVAIAGGSVDKDIYKVEARYRIDRMIKSRAMKDYKDREVSIDSLELRESLSEALNHSKKEHKYTDKERRNIVYGISVIKGIEKDTGMLSGAEIERLMILSVNRNRRSRFQATAIEIMKVGDYIPYRMSFDRNTATLGWVEIGEYDNYWKDSKEDKDVRDIVENNIIWGYDIGKNIYGICIYSGKVVIMKRVGGLNNGVVVGIIE